MLISCRRRRRAVCGGGDRKSGVEGKSVDLGGRRIIKKKNSAERPQLDVIARIADNVRVALARLLLTEPRAALELSAGMRLFWWVRGFFFQAEDGIRDTSVTGVQTCALPIWKYSSIAQRAATASKMSRTSADV